ncbi:hypothetical protein [Geitlerinema calcuttense]|uniref:Uncharacterized protein n=1 Tax=Geitlerinema calcuttense NRMC-F 0142 TaxID=2922238 RepID=A0ABT7LXQ2_9CYAN|nr:hypothetical protein [Geitlerinema calcuttense]MDL5055880.1 hypothetical protein [Geitlerinema calcuttense NRMC-F 0142]
MGQINTLIAQGVSFRTISHRIQNNDKARYSLQRHTENCLKVNIGGAVEQKKVDQAVDVVKEFHELLLESKNALESARSSLTVNGKVDFSPRAWEVLVVYEDLDDINEKSGKPAVKKENLADLLARVEGNANIIPLHSFVKIQDCRKTYLETIARVDGIIDRFAKLSGAYQLPKDNEADKQLQEIKTRVQVRAAVSGRTYEAELQYFLEHYSSAIQPDIKHQLVSQSVM